jgi:hypothetical protein
MEDRSMTARQLFLLLLGFAALCNIAFAAEDAQYELGEIRIPAASADEPIRDEFSLTLATQYLDQGARAWKETRKCVTCHTTGTYMTIRPALARRLGPPETEFREHFVATLEELTETDRDTLKRSIRPAQVIYTAAGLAEWDKHVTGRLSDETKQALTHVGIARLLAPLRIGLVSSGNRGGDGHCCRARLA